MSKPLRFIEEPARSTPVKAETQVLVIGGGSAGVSAGVAPGPQGGRRLPGEWRRLGRRIGGCRRGPSGG